MLALFGRNNVYGGHFVANCLHFLQIVQKHACKESYFIRNIFLVFCGWYKQLTISLLEKDKGH